MSIDRVLLGAGAAILGAIMTFMLPVSARRVNQTVVALMIIVLFLTASFMLLDSPQSWVAGIVASLVALGYRTVLRWIRQAVWSITKFTRRDYYYRKVGQALLSRGRRSRRRRG